MLSQIEFSYPNITWIRLRYAGIREDWYTKPTFNHQIKWFFNLLHKKCQHLGSSPSQQFTTVRMIKLIIRSKPIISSPATNSNNVWNNKIQVSLSVSQSNPSLIDWKYWTPLSHPLSLEPFLWPRYFNEINEFLHLN